jgi:hypothetical protein
MIQICDCIETIEDDGSKSLRPAIPFTEFPPGHREARPDEDGKLCWYIEPD